MRYVLEAQGAVPLSFTDGSPEPPFSIGRRGDWRVDGSRVLDVHAFFVFDGRQAFARSAADADPADADGRPLPTTWAPLPLPCRLRFGDVVATLRPEAEPAHAAASRPPAVVPVAPAPSMPPLPLPPAPPAPSAAPEAPARRKSAALGRAIAAVVLFASFGVAGYVIYQRQHRPLPPAPIDTAPVAAVPDDPPDVPLGIVVFPSPPIAASADAGAPPRGSAQTDAGVPPSLQRVAVDALHRGDPQAAAAAYETLAAQHPENPAFARAARTLRK